MGTKAKEIFTEKNINFGKFCSDLNAKLAERGTNAAEVSRERLFRGSSYISSCVSKHKIPANVFFALCEWFDLTAKDYEIKPEPKPAPKPVEDEQTADPGGLNENGYTCEMKIDPAFNTLMVRILKNGEVFAIGRSFLYGQGDTDIVKSFSYAAHMAYKTSQQAMLGDINEGTERVVFKDWIKRYAGKNSDAGSFARYVDSHYAKFPASGKKEMIAYLAQNKGSTHIAAFRQTFDQYLKWYMEQRV